VTLQSFLTKNNFEALGTERPSKTVRLGHTTTLADTPQVSGRATLAVTSAKAPAPASPVVVTTRHDHDTTRHDHNDTTRHDHNDSKPRLTVADLMQKCKDTQAEQSGALQGAITEAENIMKSLNVLSYSEPPTELCAVEPEVVKVKVAIDSAACDNVINPKERPQDAEWEPNETNKHFVGANESPIERYGSCKTIMSSKHGKVGCCWQMAAVSRALHSVGIVAGPKGGPGKQDLLFNNDKCYVVAPGVVKAMMQHLKAVAEYDREGNLYVGEVSLSSFTRQGETE